MAYTRQGPIVSGIDPFGTLAGSSTAARNLTRSPLRKAASILLKISASLQRSASGSICLLSAVGLISTWRTLPAYHASRAGLIGPNLASLRQAAFQICEQISVRGSDVDGFLRAGFSC